MAIPTRKLLDDELDHMDEHEQREMLDHARSMKHGLPPGTKGEDLLKYAGIVPEEDAREMLQAIEEGCEQIDAEE